MNSTSLMTGVKKYTMVIVLVILTIFFNYMTQGKILSPNSLSNLIAQNAYVFVLATGMLLCILTGGNIDLSVGSVVCFVGAVGAWQGFWIAFVRVPPFIVTLSGMLIFRGLSNVVLQGMTVSLKSVGFIKTFGGGADCYVPDFFQVEGFNVTCMLAGAIACVIYLGIVLKGRLTRSKKGYETESLVVTLIRTLIICAVILAFSYKIALYRGIPTALIWVMVIVLVYGYITSKTTTGRYFYAVGGNEKATKLSGINTNKVYFIAYTNMGLLAALAGMLTIARMTSAQPTYGQNYEMDAIGSCFIGGASAYGGVGTVPGVIVGAVIMGIINLGMSSMGVDANYQKVVKGLVLLVAVIFDVMTKKADK